MSPWSLLIRRIKCEIRGHRWPVGFAIAVGKYDNMPQIACERCGKMAYATRLEAEKPTVVEPQPPHVEPTPEPASSYPWTGKAVTDATEQSRAHDEIHQGPEVFKLDYARIVGGRCEYSPRFTEGWKNDGHMTSRAVLMFRVGDRWYRSAFAGWADKDGHDAREGSWCATNEFTTWNSPNPLQADELWFAVAQRSGGKRSSFSKVR